jgi:hypothetical protein
MNGFESFSLNFKQLARSRAVDLKLGGGFFDCRF